MSLSVNFVDCLIVLIVIVSAGYAAWRGFIWETLTIFAWVTASFGCLYFGPYVIPLMRSLVGEGLLAKVLAYAAVFLAVFIPFAFISHRFSQTVKNSPIGPLDRAAGVAFGVVRGLVLVGLSYLAFTYFVDIRQQPDWVTKAQLLPIVQSTAKVLLTVVPDQNSSFYDGARQEVIRQAPPQLDQNANNQLSAPTAHDPMAELIRKNEAAGPQKTPELAQQSTPKPVQHKSAAKVTKSYGASDRQALDKLVQTGGSANR
jgi:membrane protein required for colicin V production